MLMKFAKVMRLLKSLKETKVQTVNRNRNGITLSYLMKPDMK